MAVCGPSGYEFQDCPRFGAHFSVHCATNSPGSVSKAELSSDQFMRIWQRTYGLRKIVHCHFNDQRYWQRVQDDNYEGQRPRWAYELAKP